MPGTIRDLLIKWFKANNPIKIACAPLTLPLSGSPELLLTLSLLDYPLVVLEL